MELWYSVTRLSSVIYWRLIQEMHTCGCICINRSICFLSPWFLIIDPIQHRDFPDSSFLHVNGPCPYLCVLLKELRAIERSCNSFCDIIFCCVAGAIPPHQIVDMLFNESI